MANDNHNEAYNEFEDYPGLPGNERCKIARLLGAANLSACSTGYSTVVGWGDGVGGGREALRLSCVGLRANVFEAVGWVGERGSECLGCLTPGLPGDMYETNSGSAY